MKKKIITNSFEETRKLGFDFAKTLTGGDVILLHGDLGSGKTTFVQGMAEGLGISKRIISPTFIIMRSYVIPAKAGIQTGSPIEVGDDNIFFYHVDLYRIENERDVEGLGLLEIIAGQESIVVIEWPEKIEHLLPAKRQNLFFTYIDNERRSIVFE